MQVKCFLTHVYIYNLLFSTKCLVLFQGIPLLDELRGQNTLGAGTLRVRRQGVPRAIQDTRLRKGDVIFRRRGDLLALKWRDKKDVAFLTNAHQSTMADSRTRRDANGTPSIIH